MQKVTIVTFLVSSVLTLVSGHAFSASVPKHLQEPKPATVVRPAILAALNNKVVMSADQAIKIEEKNPGKKFSAAIAISRGRSLVDFQDGSRQDSMEYLFIPSYKLSVGSISSKLSYAQDLKDDSPEASTISDASITAATFSGWILTTRLSSFLNLRLQ